MSRRRRNGIITGVVAAFATAVTIPIVQAATGAGTEVGQAVVDAARGAAPTPRATSSSCRLRGAGPTAEPDPRCTPGTTNPAVTPATIRTTICVPGWSTSVRPPVTVTNRIKGERISAYRILLPATAVELDHLIPLSLGGGTRDVANLWPEPDPAPNVKDAVERAAQTAVCRHGRDLRLTQRQMAADWIGLGRTLGVKGLPAARRAS